jgi:hypothetical protein
MRINAFKLGFLIKKIKEILYEKDFSRLASFIFWLSGGAVCHILISADHR